MLKNFWYVAELSSAITQKATQVSLLGQKLVLFRQASGQVVALSDLCIHRGGSLAGGTIDHDCVRCPYHGWAFGSDGACTSIPANPAGAPIPKKARVDAYPVQEKYGWVWVFMGDLPEAERPPLPPFPEFEQPGWKPLWGRFAWNAHYTRVVENAVDISHTPFVHAGSFGNPNEPEIKDYTVVTSDVSVAMSTTLRPPAPKGLWKFLRKKDRPDVKAATAVYMPCVSRLDIDLGAFRFVVIAVHVPVDETTTISHWCQVRNFFTGGWADGDARKRMLKIFREDQPTVESQLPKIVPYDIGQELSVKSDAIQIAYRRMRKRFIDKGWQLDRERIAQELTGKEEWVIPSPARRQPEFKNAWVIREAPMQAPPQARERGADHTGEG